MSDRNFSRKQPSRLFTPVRLGVAAVAACFISGPVLSNPLNPTVVNGTAAFNQAGKVLTVTNSPGAIINWQKFSINAGETTHFAQTSASSSVLNRVLSDPTAIYGTLSSNGRVWLVNPAGILVGPGGRVDVAAFVASTLNISNADFLAGRSVFINDGNAKNVINQGEIRTPAGGSVYLIGSNVSNEGLITTPQGETILAAGATVSLIDSATPGVKVDITGVAGNATNLGTITAEAGRIGIAGVIVRNSGTVNASSVVNEGGRIFLKASQDAYVDGNGRIVTTGTKGGSVEVLGNRVAVMDNAEIDASGTNGGGRILIGGDYQGKNPEIQNANITYFGPDATLKADATEVGDGGTVIVWADDTTRAYGSISARGGALGGNGGFVETSGKLYLAVDGIRVNTGGGNWLLDPTDLCVYGGTGTCSPGFSTISDATLSANLSGGNVTLQTDGAGSGEGNIEFVGASITPNAAYGLSVLAYGGGTAFGNIDISGSSFQLGSGALTLVAGWDGFAGNQPTPLDGTDGSITITDSSLRAGPVVMRAVGNLSAIGVNTGTWIQSSGTMDVQASNIFLTGGSNFGLNPSDASYGAGVMLKSAGTQTVTANGSIVLQAGSANNIYGGNPIYGGSVGIVSNVNQTVSANVIRVLAGASGHDNSAQIQALGIQTINITDTGGLLEIKGGGSAGSGTYNNQASIQHGTFGYYGGGFGDQTITIDGGGSVAITAGSGDGVLGYYDQDCAAVLGVAACRGSSNSAQIENVVGYQTLSFGAAYGGSLGSLTITGGSAGSNNWAGVENEGTGSLNITGYANITLNGGSGGGKAVGDPTDDFDLTNDAGIYSDQGSIFIDAGTLTINGGTATHGGAGISHDGAVSGSVQLQINTTGDLIMTGGSSNADHPYATPAAIHSEGVPIYLGVGGNLVIAGGSGSSGPAIIGSVVTSASVSISTGGNVDFIDNGGGVTIGSYSAYGANVSINAGGNINFSGGATGVLIGSVSDLLGPTSVFLSAGKGITAAGTAEGVWLGVGDLTGAYGSSVALNAGWNSGSAVPSGYGGDITLTGPVYIQTDGATGTIDIVANESSAGAYGSVTIGAGVGTIAYGSSIAIVAGGNNDVAGTLISTGEISLDAGWSPYGGGATLRGGNLTLASTSNLQMAYGFMSAKAGTGSPYGGGNITQSGSLAASGFISLIADRDISINGSVISSGSNIYLYAGDNATGQFGGNILLAGTISGYGGISFVAEAGNSSGLNGNITQTSAGSITAETGYVTITGHGNAILDGSVTASTGGISASAGLIVGEVGNYSSLYGGNISLAGTIVGNVYVELSAGAGTSSGLNGDITQSSGSISSYGGIGINADGNLYLDGAVANNSAGGGVYGVAGYSGAAGKMLRISNISSSPGGYVNFQSTGDAVIGSINAPAGQVGQVIIQAGGAITQNTGTGISAASVIASSYGGVYLGESANSIAGFDASNSSATVGDIVLVNSYGGTLSLGAISNAYGGIGIQTTGALSGSAPIQAAGILPSSYLPGGQSGVGVGLISAGIDIYGGVAGGPGRVVMDAGSGALTLHTGSQITSSYGGDAILLSGASFSNQSSYGGSALSAGGGRWLVWANDPNAVYGGGLAESFRQYDSNLGAYIDDTQPVLGSGDGFLFAANPVITLSLSGTTTKTYDATTLSSGDGLALGGSSVYGDLITFTGTYAYDTKNAGTGKLVTATVDANPGSGFYGGIPVYGVTTSGSTASIYGGTITAASISAVTGITASNKIYDATTAATLNTGAAGFSGMYGGDVLTVGAASGAFSDKNVGAAKTVNITGLTLSGTDAGNYILSVTTASTTADITQLASVEWTGAGGNSLWSNPANWTGNAIPDRANVAAVSLGGAAVSYDYSGGLAPDAAILTSVSGTGSLALAGGTLTVNGGSVTIPTWVQTAGNLAGSGSLTVSQSMTMSDPGSINIGGPVNINHTGNLTLGSITTGSTLAATATGDLSLAAPLTSAGDMDLSAANGVLTIGQSVSAANLSLAGSTINIDGGFLSGTNVALTGSTVNIVGSDIFAANTASMTGSEINIDGSFVTATDIAFNGPAAGTGNLNLANGDAAASGQLTFNLANVTASYGGGLTADSSTSNITGFVSGNITLDQGGFFAAGNDIVLTLAGVNSTVSMSNGGFMLADYVTLIPATIYLDFLARSSGGVLIDGIAMTTSPSSTGSGFFVVDLSTPAVAGAGLAVAFGNPIVVVDPCASSPDLCSPPVPIESPIPEAVELVAVDPCASNPDSVECKLQTPGNEEEQKDIFGGQEEFGIKDGTWTQKTIPQCGI